MSQCSIREFSRTALSPDLMFPILFPSQACMLQVIACLYIARIIKRTVVIVVHGNITDFSFIACLYHMCACSCQQRISSNRTVPMFRQGKLHAKTEGCRCMKTYQRFRVGLCMLNKDRFQSDWNILTNLSCPAGVTGQLSLNQEGIYFDQFKSF